MIRLTDKHAFFYTEWPSNFWRTKFTWKAFGEEHEFFCTEQAFMWAKAKYFGDNDSAARILEADDPLKCKQLGRLVKGYDDKQWSLVRYSFMRDVNFEKYSQDTKLKEKLLDSAFDGKEFVEASPTDRIWGIGFAQVDAPDDESQWLGQNLLGKVLTQVRAEILYGVEPICRYNDYPMFSYSEQGYLEVGRKFLSGARCNSLEVFCSAWNANLTDNELAKIKAVYPDSYKDCLEMKMNIFVDDVCAKLVWNVRGLNVSFDGYSAFLHHASFRAIADVIEAATEWLSTHNLDELSEEFYVEAEQEIAKAAVEVLKLS